MDQSSLGLDYLAPTGSIGIIVIMVGVIFSGMIFYIIYAVSTNKESIDDKKSRLEKEAIQKEKIDKLFPKRK